MSAPFTQESASLTVSPPVGGLASGVVGPPAGATVAYDAPILTGYTQVYTNKALTSTPAVASPKVGDDGSAVVGLSSGFYDLISPTGTVILYNTNGGGNLPNSQGFVSVGGTWLVVQDSTAIGFLVFKNNAFFSANVSSLGASTYLGMSPSGKYVMIVDTATSTCELWVGA
jgi:hypothetical protein